nr:cytochrome P450 4V2 [Helicoverpa armigera]WRX06003.1 CYP340G1 [Helicoverpa armigera]
MLSALLLCIFWGVCAVIAWRAYSGKGSAHPLPPVLSGGIPIIGHTHVISGNTKTIWDVLKSMSMESVRNGGLIYAHIGGKIYYLVTDPDDALTVANTCLQKHFIYNYLDNWLGNGLLTASGAAWQRHRKLLNPAFTVSVIHNFLGIFNHMAKQFNSELAAHAGKEPFEISHYLRLIAFQTFSRTAFGIGDESVKEFARKYMESSDQLMNMVVYRFQNVWLHSDLIFRLTGLKKKEQKLIKTLDDMANQVIKRKKEELKHQSKEPETGTRCKPLMSLLLELKNDDTLTEKEIKEEVDTAILAGFDTTSNTLTCMLVLIGSHPEVQRKMYEEMIDVLGPTRDVEKDDIKKLVYTEAVIKEALRVLPIGPALMRNVDKDVKLRNYTMRAGSQCVILPVGTHHAPEWGDDVDVFRPERWLDPAIATLGNGAFFGFSLGKRSCIGKTYAMISMKVTLSHFIRRYRITADVTKMELKVDMILKPTTAAVTIEERNLLN